MKKFLAVCAFLALSGAAMAYDVTTSFKGTVDVKFNWVNFADLDEDIQNCNDWHNFSVKYDAYLVLCYDAILCPVCPFNVEEAALWLVDKKTKQVFFSDLTDGGISSAQGYCFGNGNVGVVLTTFMPYVNYDSSSDYVYLTSPEVTFVLTGGREKYSVKKNSEILNLTGGVALADVYYDGSPDRVTASELECYDGSELLFANVTFKKDNARIKADPYCPECATDCFAVYTATESKVMKASKKYLWWTVYGEDDVQLWY